MLERASFWKVHRFFIEQQPATKREIVQGMRKRQEELCDCAQLSSWLTRTSDWAWITGRVGLFPNKKCAVANASPASRGAQPSRKVL